MKPSIGKEATITADYVRDRLNYEPATGLFFWKDGDHFGMVAGWIEADGYRRISLKGMNVLAHRLAWLYTEGSWPANELDHRNGKHHDNRWDNLRLSDRVRNMQNQRRARADNTTGLLGVSPHGERYRARIMLDGKPIRLGTFDTAEAAHAAYVAAKRRLHPASTL